jgi:hypothetical protein
MSESVQPSLLEQLRQRVQQDVAPGPMSTNERLAAFGRGVLSNRGSLLDNLSAGLANQQQAEAARRAENLKTTEAEGTLAYRDAQTRLEEAKQRYEQDPTNPRNALYLAQAQQAVGMADYYRQGGRGAGGASTRGTYTERDIATRLANLPREASVNVDRILRNMPIQPQPAERQQLIAREAESLRASFLDELEAMGGQYAERAAALRAGRPAGPPQGPQGQRVQLPLTGTPRPAPTGQ